MRPSSSEEIQWRDLLFGFNLKLLSIESLFTVQSISNLAISFENFESKIAQSLFDIPQRQL